MTGRAWPTAVLLVVMAGPASAHPPPPGIGGFAGGLLHPLFVPAHMLAVLALGLLLGQQVAAWRRTAALAFVVGLAVGLGVMTFGMVPVLINEAVLACALIAALLVTLAWPVPEAAACVFAALGGFCIALDSPPEVISVREANLILVGTGIGGTLLLIVVVEVASRLTPPWARVAARVVGSWIAASAILMLALRWIG